MKQPRPFISQRYPKAAIEYDAAMSFEEIARRLGISKQLAYFYFVSGLNKLRRSGRMYQLLQLSELKQQLESDRTYEKQVSR